MRILLTGGAGFVGSHLAERLLKDNHEVLCLDNFCDYYDPRLKRDNVKEALKHRNYKLIEADIGDKTKLLKIFRDNKIDKVIHLAAQPGVRYSLENPHVYFDVNVNGTINILNLCRESKVKGLFFGSSSSVYGISKKIPFSEDGETLPISPYGVSKRTCELLCFNYHHLYHLPIVVFRFFTVYGPRQRPDMAISKFTKAIQNNKTINVFGNGKTSRDYTYITDIIEGVSSALNKKFNFEIFNLGNSNPVTLLHLISLIEENLGKKARLNYLPEQAGDPPLTYADINKSKKILRYDPKINIHEGIKEYVSWYKNEKS